MRQNEHTDRGEGGVWWEVVDTVLTIVIGATGGTLLAWMMLSAMLWAERMGWLG